MPDFVPAGLVICLAYIHFPMHFSAGQVLVRLIASNAFSYCLKS